jgi:hypothetical protein
MNSDIQPWQKLESTAHELFHAYQFEEGQMLNGKLNTINNEVGAYLFGRAVAVSVSGGAISFGITGSIVGQKYNQAMQSLLFGSKFDLREYQDAVKYFKQGSGANLEAKGMYNSFAIDTKLTNPLIKQFIPLLQ